MAIRNTLESLKWTCKEIESYESMKHQTIELYQSVDYQSDTMHRMIDYTNKRISEEEAHYNYWQNLITKIDDDGYRNILMMRYLEDRTVEEVAEELFYSVEHVYRLTNQAVEELAKLHEKQAHSKGYKVEFIQ